MKISALTALKRETTRLLFVALAPFALDGCVSVGVTNTALPAGGPEAPGTGTLEARLYETGSDARTGQASQRPVTWKLYSRSKPSEQPVREGTGSVWSVTDLEPGKYNIVVSAFPQASSPAKKPERPLEIFDSGGFLRQKHQG